MSCCQSCWLFGSRTLRPQDTSAPRHFGTTKLVPKFKTNHRWSCVSSGVEVSRLFLDHGTLVEVSGTKFLVSKCLEIGAEVSQSVLMPKCLVAEVSGNRLFKYSTLVYNTTPNYIHLRLRFSTLLYDSRLLTAAQQQDQLELGKRLCLG